MRYIIFFIFSLLSIQGYASQVEVHDPVMTREGDHYYAFSTGLGITIYQSEDMKNWRRTGQVFYDEPEWVRKEVPQFMGHLWAPDVYFKDGRYYLYYSASAFGKNTSAMGVASTPTLNPKSPDYKWTDHGMIIKSIPSRDDWNAIDPAIIEADGKVWMSFGSFWSGLKMVRLTDEMDALYEPQEWHHIASRSKANISNMAQAGNGAIEAPYIFKKGDYFYLFVSFDLCCRKENSTYKVMVGRSHSVTGPYVDRDGAELNNGGGTLVLAGNERWKALGHNSAYTFDGKDYLVLHAYETSDNYLQKLRILPMNWEDGWPVVDPQTLDSHTTRLLEE